MCISYRSCCPTLKIKSSDRYFFNGGRRIKSDVWAEKATLWLKMWFLSSTIFQLNRCSQLSWGMQPVVSQRQALPRLRCVGREFLLRWVS